MASMHNPKKGITYIKFDGKAQTLINMYLDRYKEIIGVKP
jgi:hypothetical protein